MNFSLVNPYFETNEIPQDNIIVPVTQLICINRKEILKYLIKNGKVDAAMADHNVVTNNPRNFYIDVLMSKNYDLLYDEDQIPNEEPAKIKRLIKLPVNFEIVLPDLEYKIDCQTEYITVNHFNVIRKIGEGTYAEIFLV
jgi:hypothetical protein